MYILAPSLYIIFGGLGDSVYVVLDVEKGVMLRFNNSPLIVRADRVWPLVEMS